MEKLFEMIKRYADATKPPRQAVCVCALKGDKVLAVAQRGTTHEWGLPGGKVEPGENLKEALVREVKEEAHITLDQNKLEPVFYRIDHPFFVTTYLYQGDVDEIPEQGDAGPAGWVSWEDLLSGPFGEYNARLKHKLGL